MLDEFDVNVFENQEINNIIANKNYEGFNSALFFNGIIPVARTHSKQYFELIQISIKVLPRLFINHSS